MIQKRVPTFNNIWEKIVITQRLHKNNKMQKNHQKCVLYLFG